MGDRTLYDEDILVWSEQQAAALRSLASRRDLPNELDLANVIEEIEDVGRSEFHTVESHDARMILAHLVLPGRRSRLTGVARLDRGGHGDGTSRTPPADHVRRCGRGLDMESLWRRALEVASREAGLAGTKTRPRCA